VFLLYILYLYFNPSQATNILPCERAKLVAMDLDTLLAEVNRSREGIADGDEIGKSALDLFAQLRLQAGLSHA